MERSAFRELTAEETLVDIIPNEIWCHVFNFALPVDLPPCLFVCKTWRAVVSDTLRTWNKSNRQKFYVHCFKHNYENVIRWCLRRGFVADFLKRIGDPILLQPADYYAAKRGNKTLVSFIVEPPVVSRRVSNEGRRLDVYSALRGAVKAGNCSMINYVFEKHVKPVFSDTKMKNLKKKINEHGLLPKKISFPPGLNNMSHVFDWRFVKGIRISRATLNFLAQYIPVTPQALIIITENPQPDTFERAVALCKSSGYPDVNHRFRVSNTIVNNICGSNRLKKKSRTEYNEEGDRLALETIKIAHKHNFVFSSVNFVNAIRAGYTLVVGFLKDVLTPDEFPVAEIVYFAAAENGSTRVFKYLNDNICSYARVARYIVSECTLFSRALSEKRDTCGEFLVLIVDEILKTPEQERDGKLVDCIRCLLSYEKEIVEKHKPILRKMYFTFCDVIRRYVAGYIADKNYAYLLEG